MEAGRKQKYAAINGKERGENIGIFQDLGHIHSKSKDLIGTRL